MLMEKPPTQDTGSKDSFEQDRQVLVPQGSQLLETDQEQIGTRQCKGLGKSLPNNWNTITRSAEILVHIPTLFPELKFVINQSLLDRETIRFLFSRLFLQKDEIISHNQI